MKSFPSYNQSHSCIVGNVERLQILGKTIHVYGSDRNYAVKVNSLPSFSGLTGESSSYFWIARSFD